MRAGREMSGGFSESLRADPEIGKDESAVGTGRYAGQVNGEVLLGHVVCDFRNDQAEHGLQLLDGDRFAGTAVGHSAVAGSVGDKFIGAEISFEKTLGPEDIRVAPDARVVVGAVEIEEHPITFFEAMIAPLERLDYAST